jgi:hypothetical protein
VYLVYQLRPIFNYLWTNALGAVLYLVFANVKIKPLFCGANINADMAVCN